jgi:hypothetical protein
VPPVAPVPPVPPVGGVSSPVEEQPNARAVTANARSTRRIERDRFIGNLSWKVRSGASAIFRRRIVRALLLRESQLAF